MVYKMMMYSFVNCLGSVDVKLIEHLLEALVRQQLVEAVHSVYLNVNNLLQMLALNRHR